MSETITGNQERNIMILFLSNYHGFKYKDYKEAKLVGEGDSYTIFDSKSVKCIETNEAPLKDIQTYIGKPLDAIFYFATKAVRNLPTKKQPNPKESPIKMYLHEDDEQAKPFKSDEEFFWEVLAPRVLGTDFKIHTQLIAVPFNEDDDDPIQSSIMAATAMKEAINDYLGKIPVSCCHFYADITGGPRPANMAMSAVMQLLQYEDAKLERVVYSDLDFRKVSNMQPINDLYMLIAGVDAFTKYGRSDTIEKYFNYEFSTNGKENTPKNELENLLAAMHRFADAMSLCWPDYIIRKLEDLMEALDAFAKKDCTTPKEKLLIQLLPTIRDKYELLFSDKSEQKRTIDRLSVIGWCIENNLIQPALTFCTEWLPKYIVDYGAIYTDNRAIQLYCKQQNKDGDNETNGKKYFVMDFPMNRPDQEHSFIDENTGKKSKTKKSALKKIAENALKVEADMIINARGDLSRIGSQVKTMEKNCRRKISALVSSIKERLDALKRGIPYDTDDENAYIFNSLIKSIKRATGKTESQITPEDVYEKMKTWSWKDIVDKYHHKPPKVYVYVKMFDALDEDSSKKAEEICLEMLHSEIIKTSLRKRNGTPDYEKAAEHIRRYTNIRSNIRNTSLHAADTAKSKKKVPQTFTEVKNELETCLNLVKDLVTNEQAIAHKAKNVWPDTPKKEEATP